LVLYKNYLLNLRLIKNIFKKEKNIMRKKQIYILVLLGILILLSSLGIHYYNNNNKAFIGILFSDASIKDSELKILNENFHNKKSIKLNAMDAPMVSYINNSVYIPTSLDNKLFYIDNNFKVSEEKVDDGASFVRTKKNGRLIFQEIKSMGIIIECIFLVIIKRMHLILKIPYYYVEILIINIYML